MNILKDVDRVKTLLLLSDTFKNSDQKLAARVWYDQCSENNVNPNKITAFEFFRMYADDYFCKAQVLIRIRAKLQSEFPELRGDVYYARHKEAIDVRKQLYETPELLKGGTP